MPRFEPAVLDILASAFDRALEQLNGTQDRERAKKILLTGLVDMAQAGIRDEAALADFAMARLSQQERTLQAS